jgi:integrase
VTRELAAIDAAIAEALRAPAKAEAKDAAYYLRKAKSENTWRAYRSDVRHFVRWAGIADPFPTTPEVIGQYLMDCAQDPTQPQAPTTLAHRLAALSFVHAARGFTDPTQDPYVRELLKGIRRDRIDEGWEEAQAPTFDLERLVAMLAPMGPSPHDQRDRAYILTGLFAALRQSELTALTVDQLHASADGLVIRMGPTKTDRLNERRQMKALPKGPDGFCPVRALQGWLQAAQITVGPVFRGIDRHGHVSARPLSHTTTNRIIKKWAARAGLAEPQRYSGHSLRASFITLARELRIPDPVIARQSHHRDLRTLDLYDRPRQVFEGNPSLEVMAALAERLQPKP